MPATNPPACTAVIVDDEPQGIALLRNLLENYCPQINLLGTAQQAEQAFELISSTSPQLVFLDVEMPGGSGFHLLEKFEEVPFKIIFTTAHEKYAINAIHFSAVDYLLKPISIKELKAAVSKATRPASPLQPEQLQVLETGIRTRRLPEKIPLPVQDGIRFVSIDEIIYCEGSSNYTFFFLRDSSKILVSRTLKEYEELLGEHRFFRIHQSYLINLNSVKRYIRGRGGYVVLENNVELPVSTRKKDQFLSIAGTF